MKMIDAVLMEMEQEAGATRRILERVPEDRLTWRPHPRSWSLGQLALHIAGLQGGVSELVAMDSIEAPSFDQKEATSRAEILSTFDDGQKSARATLSTIEDSQMMAPWTVRGNGRVLMTVPRAGVIRSILLNHHYHHRGQLSVYLRLLDVPVPSIYGPSADENPFADDASRELSGVAAPQAAQ
jgi:uncharacterized damage-inducible protein DinB